MPFQAPGNRPYGHLSAAILASATSLTLNSAAEAARFHAIAAGDFYYLILVDTAHPDLDDNWTIVKATAKSSSTFTIAGGFDGTAAKAMPRSSVGDPTKVRVWAPMSEMQLWMYLTGGGAVVQAAMPTVSADSPELFLLTPAAAGNFDLPTTNVWAGARYEIHNLSSTGANVITVRSSDTSTVCILPADSSVILQAMQDEPTTNAHWKPETTWIDPDSLFVYGTGTQKTFKPMGAIDAQTTQVSRSSTSAGNLQTYTIPASSSGDILDALFVGTFSDPGVKIPPGLYMDFGASEVAIHIFNASTSTLSKYLVELIVVKISNSSQKIVAVGAQNTDSIAGNAQFVSSDYMTATENLLADNLLRTRSDGAGSIGSSVTGEILITTVL